MIDTKILDAVEELAAMPAKQYAVERLGAAERLGLDLGELDAAVKAVKAQTNGHAADDDTEWEVKLASAIEEMNRRYFVAMIGGKGVIARLVYDDFHKRDRLVFSSPKDIKLLYNHRHYKVGLTSRGKDLFRDLGTAWVEDHRRRTYDRIALIPDKQPPADVYNLWRGWGVEPRAGKWPTIFRHLLRVICGADRKHFRYLLRWIARSVQEPDKAAEIAIVLKGDKGTGKGAFGTILKKLFGLHAIQVSNPRHVTGNFNAHLADVLILIVNEAFWAGDKAADGVLKDMITDPTIRIERKGVDVIEVPNMLKLVLMANADWVVPATADERRYFVLDVPDARKDDFDYFNKLFAAIEGDELPAFLAHLKAMNLKGFNHRKAPDTKALSEQKIIGADALTKFMLSCLEQGGIVGTEFDDHWPSSIEKQLFYRAYQDFAAGLGERYNMTDGLMVKRLKKIWPGGVVRATRPRESNLDGKRPPHFVLESLKDHRAAFLSGMKIDVEHYPWPVIDGDQP